MPPVRFFWGIRLVLLIPSARHRGLFVMLHLAMNCLKISTNTAKENRLFSLAEEELSAGENNRLWRQ